MAEGLRERKKRETRQRISDIATGLFLEHGFVTVTIAEVADAADVSVNTVYNYFPAKEDLFFDRSRGVVDRLSRWVRGRRVGESAAVAVLRELREEVEAVSPRVGLMEGYDRFMRVIHDAPALRSRLWSLQQEVHDDLEAALREETGADPGRSDAGPDGRADRLAPPDGHEQHQPRDDGVPRSGRSVPRGAGAARRHGGPFEREGPQLRRTGGGMSRSV